MKPDVTHKTFGIANKYIAIGLVVFFSIGISAWGLGSMITADNSNLGDVLTVSYSGTDTATIQAYFNTSGISEIILNGDMTINTIIVPSNIRKISGNAIIRQKTVPGNAFNVYNTANLTIEGLYFIGQTADASVSGNSAIDVLNSTHVDVRDNYFTGWRYLGVRIRNSTNVDVYRNDFYNNSHGINLESVQSSNIYENNITKSQYSHFSAGIGVQNFDAYFGTKSRNNDISIHNNNFHDLINAQAILVHDGINISIQDNNIYNTLDGISISTFNSNDRIDNIKITGNSAVGSSIASVDTTANYCIDLEGLGNGGRSQNNLISNNICDNFNAATLGDFTMATIIIQTVNETIVSDNIITNAYSLGMFVYGGNNNLTIRGNNIIPLSVNAESAGIFISTGVQNRTIIEDNLINAIGQAGHFGIYSAVAPNNIQVLNNIIYNAPPANSIYAVSGTYYRLYNNFGYAGTDWGSASIAPAAFGEGDTFYNNSVFSHQQCWYKGSTLSWRNATNVTTGCST